METPICGKRTSATNHLLTNPHVGISEENAHGEEVDGSRFFGGRDNKDAFLDSSRHWSQFQSVEIVVNQQTSWFNQEQWRFYQEKWTHNEENIDVLPGKHGGFD